MVGWTKYSLIFLLISILSCAKEKKPAGLLPKSEMVSLMMEMYLAEARITISRLPKDSAFQLFFPFEKSVLEKHGISDSTLKANYTYYLEKPAEMESLVDAVIDSLSLREQRIEK